MSTQVVRFHDDANVVHIYVPPSSPDNTQPHDVITHTRSRWVMLAMAALMTIGASWIYDTPGAVYSSLASRFGPTFTTTQNQVLYSVYNWPNVILAIVAGAMIDQWLGLNTSTIIVAALVVVGQVLFSVAVTEVVYWVAVLGRFVYGLGGESLKVAQNTWIAQIAPDANLSLVFGVVLGVSRASGAINFALTPTIATASVLWAIWVGTILTVTSFIAALVLVRLATPPYPKHADVNIITPKQSMSIQSVWHKLCALRRIVLSFPIEAHLQFLICVFYHVGVLLLYQIVSEFLQFSGPRHSERTASLLVAIPSFIAIIGTPLCGFLVDRYGKALWSIFGSCVILLLGHILLLLFVIKSSGSTYDPQGIAICILAFVLVGISYSVATASIWPLVPFILPADQLAIGYGAMTSVENLGLAALPLILTGIQSSPNLQQQDNPWRYITPLLVLMVMAAIAAVITLIHIHIDNIHHHGKLNKPASQRRAM